MGGGEVGASIPHVEAEGKPCVFAMCCRRKTGRCDVDWGVSKSELAGCSSTSASSTVQQNLHGSVGSIGELGRSGNPRGPSSQFRKSRSIHSTSDTTQQPSG